MNIQSSEKYFSLFIETFDTKFTPFGTKGKMVNYGRSFPPEDEGKQMQNNKIHAQSICTKLVASIFRFLNMNSVLTTENKYAYGWLGEILYRST